MLILQKVVQCRKIVPEHSSGMVQFRYSVPKWYSSGTQYRNDEPTGIEVPELYSTGTQFRYCLLICSFLCNSDLLL